MHELGHEIPDDSKPATKADVQRVTYEVEKMERILSTILRRLPAKEGDYWDEPAP